MEPAVVCISTLLKAWPVVPPCVLFLSDICSVSPPCRVLFVRAVFRPPKPMLSVSITDTMLVLIFDWFLFLLLTETAVGLRSDYSDSDSSGLFFFLLYGMTWFLISYMWVSSSTGALTGLRHDGNVRSVERHLATSNLVG